MTDLIFSNAAWSPSDVGYARAHGFILAGESVGSVFERRVNEPCQHQPCPYALIAFALHESAEETARLYRHRAKHREPVLAGLRWAVWEVWVGDARTVVAQSPRAYALLADLCRGSARGLAWRQFRHLRDEYDVQTVHFPRRAGARPVLVVRDCLEELVQVEPVGLLTDF